MSEPTIIDTALSAAAGTVVKDLEPAAVTALDDLTAFVHGQADRLRAALPALEQAAVDHVRSMAAAVLGEYERVVARVESHLGGEPVAAVAAVGENAIVSNASVPGEPPAVPIVRSAAPVTQPDGPAASAPEGSVQVPAEPVTGMAPAAAESAPETTQEA